MEEKTLQELFGELEETLYLAKIEAEKFDVRGVKKSGIRARKDLFALRRLANATATAILVEARKRNAVKKEPVNKNYKLNFMKKKQTS